MTTRNSKVELNLEEKLAQLHLSPADYANAVGALRAAEGMVDLFEALRAGVKRIGSVFSLRPSRA